MDVEWSSVKYSTDQFGKLIDPRPSSGWNGESLQIKKEVATTAVMMAIFHKMDSVSTGTTSASVESEVIATRQPLKVNLQLFGGNGTVVTEETIMKAMKDAPLKTQQDSLACLLFKGMLRGLRMGKYRQQSKWIME